MLASSRKGFRARCENSEQSKKVGVFWASIGNLVEAMVLRLWFSCMKLVIEIPFEDESPDSRRELRALIRQATKKEAVLWH